MPKKPQDRDVFVPKMRPTPSGGVPVTPRAGSDVEWSEDTGTHQAPRNDDTPVGLETVADGADGAADNRLRSRVKETLTTVKGVQDTITTTNTGIDALRHETKRDVLRLETKIGEVRQQGEVMAKSVEKLADKLDEHSGVMLGVVGSVGELKGAVGELVKSNDQRREIETRTHASRIDVDSVERIMEIKDQTDAIKQKRSFRYKAGAMVLKVLGAAGVIAASAIATHFIESCNRSP